MFSELTFLRVFVTWTVGGHGVGHAYGSRGVGECVDSATEVSPVVLWGREAFGLGPWVFSHCPFYFRDWLDILAVLEKHAVKTSGKQLGSASRANQRLCVPVVLPMV